jgi:hypothetical protein
MAWWFLVSLAVYGEPLPGDRQFWVTRPYCWTSLLGAKLLFIVTFVSFPLLLADCFILTRQGLRPWESPVGMLWHELAIFTVILLPMIAVACITAGLAQAVLVGLITVAPILALGRFFGPFLSPFSEFGVVRQIDGGTDIAVGIWEPLACLVLASAALAIIILQYRARRTGVARVIFAAAVLLVLCGRFLPGESTFDLQSPLFESRIDTSSITAVFSPDSNPLPTVSPALQNPDYYGLARVTLPIRFGGAPSGTAVVVEMMLGEITPPNGKPLNTLLYFGPATPDTVWHEADLDRSLFEPVKSAPVRLHLTIYLTVLGDAHSHDMPLRVGSHRVPGVGMCELLPQPHNFSVLDCRAPFRQPAYVLARFDGSGDIRQREQQQENYSPFPAEFGINPISVFAWAVPKGATTVAFTTMKPLAHVRRDLDIPNVQLAEFAR